MPVVDKTLLQLFKAACKKAGVAQCVGSAYMPLINNVLDFMDAFLSMDIFVQDGFSQIRQIVLKQIVNDWATWTRNKVLIDGLNAFMKASSKDVSNFWYKFYSSIRTYDQRKKEITEILTILNGCVGVPLAMKLAEGLKAAKNAFRDEHKKQKEAAKKGVAAEHTVDACAAGAGKDLMQVDNPMPSVVTTHNTQTIFLRGTSTVAPTMTALLGNMYVEGDLDPEFDWDDLIKVNEGLDENVLKVAFDMMNSCILQKESSADMERETWSWNDICSKFKDRTLIVTRLPQRGVLTRKEFDFFIQMKHSSLKMQVHAFMKDGVWHYELFDGLTTTGNFLNIMYRGLNGETIKVDFENELVTIPISFWKSLRNKDWTVLVWKGHASEIKDEIRCQKKAAPHLPIFGVDGHLALAMQNAIGFGVDFGGDHPLNVDTPKMYQMQVAFAAVCSGNMYALQEDMIEEASRMIMEASENDEMPTEVRKLKTYTAGHDINEHVLMPFWKIVGFFDRKTMTPNVKIDWSVYSHRQYMTQMLLPGLNLLEFTMNSNLDMAVEEKLADYFVRSTPALEGDERAMWEIPYTEKTLTENAQKAVIERLAVAQKIWVHFETLPVSVQLHIMPVAVYMWLSVECDDTHLANFCKMIMIAKTGKHDNGKKRITRSREMPNATPLEAGIMQNLYDRMKKAQLGRLTTFEKNLWFDGFEEVLSDLAHTIFAIVMTPSLVSHFLGPDNAEKARKVAPSNGGEPGGE